MNTTATPVWGTKGFSFWTFLSLLLLQAKPRCIVELGSGRSTITLGEYAKAAQSTFVSIETDPFWLNKARLELRAIGLPERQVQLVAIDANSGWYQAQQFDAAVDGLPAVDLLFVDAPNDRSGCSYGMRDSPVGLQRIKALAASTDLLIIDDTHRRHVLDTVDQLLSEPGQFNKFFYRYAVVPNYPNSLCLCARKGSKAEQAVTAAARLLNLHFANEYDRENCPEP